MTFFKYLTLAICMNVGLSCNLSSEGPNVIPKEYSYPDSKIQKGKTFVYVSDGSVDTSFVDIFNIKKNGKRFRVERSYNKYSTSDSVIYSGNKMIEYYLYFTKRRGMWKSSNVSTYTSKTQNGNSIEVLIAKWYDNGDSIQVRSDLSKVKDTAISWKGEVYPTIQVHLNMETKSNYLVDSTGHHLESFHLGATFYLAKGIGAVERYFYGLSGNIASVSRLVEIRSMTQ